MQTIEDYVQGLQLTPEQEETAIAKLHDAGFTRYDRYYWQEIENIVKGATDEQIKP